MKILALGHSCFLLEMAPESRGQPVRILADPWLSDHVIGDVMGRFPRVRLDAQVLAPVHGVFISHSHTDHLCPYSLVQLWQELAEPPALLLPQSIQYLEPLLREYLPGGEVIVLRENEPVDVHGVRVTALFNLETRATNEDDVMVLVVDNGREVFLSESDALLPFHDPDGRAMISSILGDRELENACFLTTKNELEATMAMIDSRNLQERAERLGDSLERTYGEIHQIFEPMEDLDEDLWRNPRLVRLVGGQGIAYPQQLGTGWNRVLFPIRIGDRVRMEREVAGSLGYEQIIEELVPGEVHRVEEGRLAGREPFPHLELLDREEDRIFDPELELFEEFPAAPLRDEIRDTEAQRRRIVEMLNTRFLPHLVGSRTPPVEHLLATCGGQYRIRLRFGTVSDHVDEDQGITFARLRFHPMPTRGEPQEFYWANDLEDYLDGRCDDFSTFCRHPLFEGAPRLWSCLGMPYLNNDLVERKLRHHFERARRGESLSDWVLRFYE